MYPLSREYEKLILAFIDKLHTYPDISVSTSSMSTIVTGEYDRVMSILQAEMKLAAADEKTVFVLKVIGR